MVSVRPSGLVWSVFGAAVVIFMLAPLVLLVLFSFGRNALTAFPMGGVTLDWYRKLLANDTFWGAAENSAIVGACVGIIATVIGTMAALRLARTSEAVSAPLLLQLRAPIMLPALFVAVALMSFLRLVLDVRLGLPTAILAHLVITQPFVILIVHARMVGFDHALVESARDLGATPMQAFVTVTLPIMRATIVGAALIAVAVSLDDFIITSFTIGSGNTIPTLVWSMVRTSLDPSINASATILIALTMGVTVLALHFSRYRG
jgi:spermidine/putrescine transport system permease protein